VLGAGFFDTAKDNADETTAKVVLDAMLPDPLARLATA
jgi:hypothetical protein